VGWFKFRRTTAEVAAPPPAPAQPETDLERIARWLTHWRRVNARRDVEGGQEVRLEDEQRARRAEAGREQIAAVVARTGSYFPGDTLDGMRPGQVIPLDGAEGESGGENGPPYFWVRW
jgi:hypothetical protein